MELQNEIGLSFCPTQAREDFVSLKNGSGESHVGAWYTTALCKQPCCVPLMQTFILTPSVTRIHLSQLPQSFWRSYTQSFRTSSEPRAQNRWPALPPVMPWRSAHNVPQECSTVGPPAVRMQLSVIAQEYKFKLFKPSNPGGHYMYRQFNIQQFYVLPTHCIYVFCVDLRTNSDYFPVQH